MMQQCFLCGRAQTEYVGLYIPSHKPNRQYWYALCAQCFQRADRLAIVKRRCDAIGRYVDCYRAAPMN